MSGDFLDSNVLLCLFTPEEAGKQKRSRELLRVLMETRRGVISFQVVHEVLNVLVGKLPAPARPEDAREFLDRVLVPLWRVWPSTAL
ncbi:MAG: hypothetical protein U5S82_10470 [Gammaproteobacteria bacterium]|nr:hypothetical protein [Gammaproteobacteria bacterium]